MKISDYAIQQNSSHLVKEESQHSETLTYWQNNQDPTVVSGENASTELKQVQNVLSHVEEKVELSQQAVRSRGAADISGPELEEEAALNDLNMMVLREMIERITGKKIRIFNPSSFSQPVENNPSQSKNGASDNGAVSNQEVGNDGYGLIYDFHQSHYEHETTTFQSQGRVKTADGQEIDISVAVNMSREFYTEHNIDIRMGEALKDPLILNFGGTAAQLTERDFAFDIDSDGKLDQISFVNENSGFLAYDKNGDNVVNNGSELFGPQSGEGFDELARYDDDGNGWIDENDNIFEKLRIWQRRGDETVLLTLGEKGVGAIYLGSVDTQFSVKNDQNELLGAVRSSSVFLNEDGSAGTVQQIDLVA